MRTFYTLCFILTAKLACACSWDYPIWMIRTATADPLYRFSQGDKMGYIDQKGKIVIPPSIRFFGGNSGDEFHNGLLEINVSDGTYIDRSGKVIIDGEKLKLDRGWDFSDGLAAAMPDGTHLWGFIDTTGQFVIPPKFKTYPEGYVSSFQEGLASIIVEGKFGYIDKSGEFVIKPSFLLGDAFSGGFARVVTEGPCAHLSSDPCSYLMALPLNMKAEVGDSRQIPTTRCRYGFIDRTGRLISQNTFDDAGDFSQGLASVKIGGRWGFINESGTVVIQPQFTFVGNFSNGLARVQVNGVWGYIDKKGNAVIKPQYKRAEDFSEGLAVVDPQTGGSIYIDKTGRQAIPEHFALASHFFKGLAHVKLNRDPYKNTFAYIDRSGHYVFTYDPR